MAVTTYCVKADVEALLSVAGVLAFADDDEGGTLDATETGYITRAIERAAGRMNSRLCRRYKLSDLSGNEWCRDCNAAWAALLLAERRGEGPIESLSREVAEYQSDLDEIAAGRMRVPEKADSFEHAPSVTNFDVERFRSTQPVRVQREESTGSNSDASRKRRFARDKYVDAWP